MPQRTLNMNKIWLMMAGRGNKYFRINGRVRERKISLNITKGQLVMAWRQN